MSLSRMFSDQQVSAIGRCDRELLDAQKKSWKKKVHCFVELWPINFSQGSRGEEMRGDEIGCNQTGCWFLR